MASILDIARDTIHQETTFPVGPAAEPIGVLQVAPPAAPGHLPPPSPCDFRQTPLDLFAAPEDQLSQSPPCGCPLFWLDPYGTLHCWSCLPPRHVAMVRRKLSVVRTTAGLAWEDFATREIVVTTAEVSSPPDAANWLMRRLRGFTIAGRMLSPTSRANGYA